jgi:replicative DNA helicase
MLAGPLGASTLPELMDRIPDVLTLADYFSDLHQEIQRAIWLLRDEGIEPDPVAVASKLEQIGSQATPTYLMEILDTVPHSANVLHYAGIVARHARRRNVIEIGQQLIDRAYDPRRDDQEIVDDAFATAAKMADSLQLQAKGTKTVQRIANEVIERYSRGETPRVSWGIEMIDEVIDGVSLGSLVVLGARPRHGKSMVALQWLDSASEKGIPGLMISEEMMDDQIGDRTLMYLSDIPHESHKDNHQSLAVEAHDYFAKRAPVVVVQKCSKVAKAEKAIYRACRSHGVKIVAVDYAQLIDGDGDNEEQRISNVSKRMKQAAVRHGIIVLLLAQLNRQIEHRDNPTPKLSDLKGSGGLEADADLVLFPYWPAKFDEGYANPDEYRIVVAKDRNGGAEGKTIIVKINAQRQRLERDYGAADKF